MDIREAMELRHTVRKFSNKEIPSAIIEQLMNRTALNNSALNLRCRVLINDRNPLHAVTSLLLGKAVKNYIVLAGPDSADVEEKLGYAGADLMLYAQTLGLNSWWIGATYRKASVVAKEDRDAKVIGIIAFGYGATQGVPHKSKNREQVSSYAGNAPAWFDDGIRAALLAPTALNSQDFKITGEGSTVAIETKPGVFARTNRGIVKYHFELGAGTANFSWKTE